jgi:modification methylase
LRSVAERKRAGTKTRSFGSGKRENHDASAFYGRRILDNRGWLDVWQVISEVARPTPGAAVPVPEIWQDRIHCADARALPLPDCAVALAVTSPPYCNGKDYDLNLSLPEYLTLIAQAAAEVYRVLIPGGRYVINIANLGRSPYIPMNAYFVAIHQSLGFLPMGEVLWIKGKSMKGSCAWGSWLSSKAPRLRDVHEYLEVFAKATPTRPDRGESDLVKDDFLTSTLSTWHIRPARAKEVGHAAPFPGELARRAIQLWSYVGDTVLDPFVGSGTTCIEAAALGRRWVGIDDDPVCCAAAEQRIAASARRGGERE